MITAYLEAASPHFIKNFDRYNDLFRSRRRRGNDTQDQSKTKAAYYFAGYQYAENGWHCYGKMA